MLRHTESFSSTHMFNEHVRSLATVCEETQSQDVRQHSVSHTRSIPQLITEYYGMVQRVLSSIITVRSALGKLLYIWLPDVFYKSNKYEKSVQLTK